MLLTLPPGDSPLFLRIAEAVLDDIERGRLPPGARLPGTRALAAQLEVHRNTVVAAYRELAAQGWVEAVPGSGTRVAALPSRPWPVRPGPRRAAYSLPDPPAKRRASEDLPVGAIVLSGGRPDLTLVPVAELGRAWRAGLRTRARTLLDYGDPRGHPRLREALSTWLAVHRGLLPDSEGVIITRGCQQALDLVARGLLGPGDRVAVEALGYAPAWAALRSTGATLVPLPVDEHGLVVDALEREVELGPLRAVYLTPHHQFPTMRVLPAPRRLQLLELAARHRFMVLEDDYDHEFHFAGRPVLPLAHLDRHGSVVYLGTFSKVLAPGLRVGYAVAPPPVIDRLAAERELADRQGDLPMEHALATLIEDGTLRRHLRKAHRVYQARQQAFVHMLREVLSDRASFDVPAGGLALWVRWHGDIGRLRQRCADQGLFFDTARDTHIDGADLPWLRAGFASLDAARMEEVATRLRAATSSMPPR